MLVLLFFAFLAGLVTILSPCILPMLPIILSGAVGGGKRRPLGIVAGFVVSFTLFTLFLTTLVKLTGLSGDAVRLLAIILLFFFGLSLVTPWFAKASEALLAKFGGKINTQGKGTGFWSGVAVGVSLGALWTPCVGPILASVISLALIGAVNGAAFLIVLAFSIGAAIPMLLIVYAGRGAIQRLGWLKAHSAQIQKGFGVVLIALAVALFFQVDRLFQTTVLSIFPSYGTGLTSIEEVPIVQEQLQKLRTNQPAEKDEMQVKLPGSSHLIAAKNAKRAPELIAGGEWFNGEPVTLEQLQGKVVLIDFWTFSCINCIRTLPYLKTWHEKYADQGLVIIGVHAPEFEFEKNANNVAKAIRQFKLPYLVMQDNDFKTWRAYDNHYWPAHYFIDANGLIRYQHFGEGEYDVSEEVIQELLQEAGSLSTVPTVANPEYTVQTRTPETYLGLARAELYHPSQRIVPNVLQEYQLPKGPVANHVGLGGGWTVSNESALSTAGSVMESQFEAKDVFLVMSPENTGGSAQVLVQLDGQPIAAAAAGADVVDGSVTVDEDRLYHLVSLDSPGRHTLTLTFPDGQVAAFAFTFG